MGGGVVLVADGSGAARPEAARAYYITLGVLTFAGFVMTVLGGIRWWRAKRDPD